MNLSAYIEAAPRGTAAAMARRIRVHQVTLSQWALATKRVPVDHCPSIERETQGAVTCEEQRPDVRWVRIPDGAWPWHPQGRPCIDVARQINDAEAAHAAAA